jgi:hypothetical protein
MIARDVAAPRGRDTRDRGAEFDIAAQHTDRGDPAINFLDVVHVHAPPVVRADDFYRIRHLAARFGVKRRITEDHGDA